MWYHLLDEAFSNIKHSRFVSLLCIVIITLTIAITSALVLMSTYLRQEVEVLKDEPAIIVFLKETTDESARRTLQQQIAKHSRIKSVTYISKADALTRSKEAFGELAALITESFDDLNPLPASLEVHVEAAFLNREMLAELASQFSTFSEVEDVTYEQFSSDFIRKAEWVILGFSGLMGGTSVVIVCFSTMLAAYFRREELRVVRLMGATRWYIRIPLILQGVFLGFIGSLAGIGGFYALFRFFTPRLGDLAFLSLSQLALIVLGGVLLGLLGSLLPLNKYVNV
jgi:cell division transport system permease protein